MLIPLEIFLVFNELSLREGGPFKLRSNYNGRNVYEK